MLRNRSFQHTGSFKMKKELRHGYDYAAAAEFCIADQTFDAIF